MMLSLGLFVFELASLPFQDLQRDTSWRHARTSRVGARPASQFLGVDDDTITIAGVLLPALAGDASSLETLRQMGDDGDAYALVDGRGRVHGSWVIDRLGEGQTIFFEDGTPRKIDFMIGLHRVDDPLPPTSNQGPQP